MFKEGAFLHVCIWFRLPLRFLQPGLILMLLVKIIAINLLPSIFIVIDFCLILQFVEDLIRDEGTTEAFLDMARICVP